MSRVPEDDLVSTTPTNPQTERDVVFISKATPGDDDLALWLAPRLEAEGYKVFADILALQPGDAWRKEITSTLQYRSARMLLCCSDETLAREGVLEEIEIAKDLVKELGEPRFIVPLKIRKFHKLFGIGGLQYIDFEESWAQGFDKLLDFLEEERVPKALTPAINPQWEQYRRRLSLGVENKTEPLTSNWLRIAEVPDAIRYYEPAGASDLGVLQRACKELPFPNVQHLRGVFAFATPDEIQGALADTGRFQTRLELPVLHFAESGSADPLVQPREASNIVTAMLRQAWERFCEEKGLTSYAYSKQVGFHASDGLIDVGKKLQWGRQGGMRSSMLRNVAKGKVWNYGASANVSLWPYPHFRLKARVLFAEVAGEKNAGPVIDSTDQQFRLRRTVCKGWRNKQWLGRMMAYLELLAGESAFLSLPASPSQVIRVEAAPALFTSPVSTALPDVLQDEEDDQDLSTFGNRDIDDGDLT